MKKQLLITVFIGGIFISYSFGQAVKFATIDSELAKINVPYIPKRLADNIVPFANVHQVNKTAAAYSGKKEATGNATEARVGRTYYDLQCNNSIGRRIVNDADKISAVFTTAPARDNGQFTGRGTGYNYYNGTSWSNTSTNTTNRIENQRTGFSAIGITASGKEVIVCHSTENQDLYVSISNKGENSWTGTLLNSPHTQGNWWPKMAISGDTIHIISLTFPTIDPGDTEDTTSAFYLGQAGAILYSRSTDGGVTWDKNFETLSLIGSDHYVGFDAEEYNIDAKGSIVNIVCGGPDKDIVLLKSSDNGNTWTKRIVEEFPIAKYKPERMRSDTNNDGIGDTLYTSDGSYAVLIDNNGKSHVWWARTRILDRSIDSSYAYFPFTDGIFYWNEDVDSSAFITGFVDLDRNSQFDFPQRTEPNRFPFGFYGLSSLSTFPSAGIDASGSLYLCYSARAGLTEYADRAYTHTNLIRSDDGGATWTSFAPGPLDVTAYYTPDEPEIGNVEGAFPSIARNVDDYIHLIEQRDLVPGHSIHAASDNPDPDNENNPSDIIYIKVPKSDLLSVGIKENKAAEKQISVYPNPLKEALNILTHSSVNTLAKISIINTLGAEVYAEQKNIFYGANTISLNTSKLAAGIYYLNYKDNSGTSTKKIVVE